MNKQDEYLDNAARTFDLATRVSNPADKSHLFDLAEKWLLLPDRSPLQSKHAVWQEHPLVKQIFRGLRSNTE